MMRRRFEEYGCEGRRHCGGRRGRGYGMFFGGFGDREHFGMRRFRSGRKLASGDLQLLILALLAEKPRHGYEIIKAIEERSRGFYVPSPGMVYPALTFLEELGQASVEEEGSKKLYHITDSGRAFLSENQATADAMLEQLAWFGEKMEHVRQAFSANETESREQGEDYRSRHRWSSELWDARRELRAALAAAIGKGVDEQRRVARILKEAAQKIRGE
jgi:DNA-binding PadR family transcriptional regulator